MDHGEQFFNSSGGGVSEYQIQRSLRFNSADSAYLSRTPASAGNRKTWTWAGWVKRSGLTASDYVHLFGYVATTPFTYTLLNFDTANDSLQFWGNSTGITLQTSNLLRDPSAWYHIVLTVDTTQAVVADRAKIYINGIETAYAVDGRSSTLSQNADLNVNNTVVHEIGGNPNHSATRYFNGYLADIHFIDGQSLDPTSFGEFDENGIWQPKAYSGGSYGTNGFHLPFNDNSTAAALGTDVSGNGNDWTVNNISVAAGAGNDSLVDSPTNYGTDTGAGGEVRGNYCTLNPLISTSSTLSNGNLNYASTATYQSSYGTIAVRTGKWYCEGTVGSFVTDATIGVSAAPFSTTTYVGGSATSWGYEGALGRIYNNLQYSAYGATFGAGDVIGVAFDAETGKLWFAKNGTWQASGNPATGTNPAVTLNTGIDYLFGVAAGNGGTWSCNFGQRPFAYPAPSGFKALNTANLPTPTIADGSTAMDVVTYTGNNNTNAITELGFSPDLVWIKARSSPVNHVLHDTVRGRGYGLYSNLTNAEPTISAAGTDLASFDSNGFTLGPNYNFNVNDSGVAFAAWTWDAGSSTVTNNDGTITSQVRANPSAGFSIVTANITNVSGSIGHGLGVVPAVIIGKNRQNSGTSWPVYHSALGANDYLFLNSTAAKATSSTIWNGTTTTTFTQGGGWTSSPYDHVFYCFAPVEGYSAFGSYVGNGSTDGPFVYTGFRPRWILVKPNVAFTAWLLHDTARNPYNASVLELQPNASSAEYSTTGVGAGERYDILSNGFKLRSGNNGANQSGATYVYAAFAENPFKTARAR